MNSPMSQIHVADPQPIEVSRPMVLMRLGYRRPAQVPERTGRLIDEIMDRGRSLLRPRAIYGTFDASTAEPAAPAEPEAAPTEPEAAPVTEEPTDG